MLLTRHKCVCEKNDKIKNNMLMIQLYIKVVMNLFPYARIKHEMLQGLYNLHY